MKVNVKFIPFEETFVLNLKKSFLIYRKVIKSLLILSIEHSIYHILITNTEIYILEQFDLESVSFTDSC